MTKQAKPDDPCKFQFPSNKLWGTRESIKPGAQNDYYRNRESTTHYMNSTLLSESPANREFSYCTRFEFVKWSRAKLKKFKSYGETQPCFLPGRCMEDMGTVFLFPLRNKGLMLPELAVPSRQPAGICWYFVFYLPILYHNYIFLPSRSNRQEAAFTDAILISG